jgi:hypothetical protein
MKLLRLQFSSAVGLVAILAAFAVWMPSGGNCADLKVYPIDLGRPAKVGEKFTVVSSVAQSSLIAIDAVNAGKPPTSIQRQNQQRVIHLEAEGEVLAVFPNGNVQEVALTVRILRITTDTDADSDVLKAGAKVTAERINQQTAFAVDGKPAAEAVAKVLHEVDPTGDSRQTQQEVFGPSHPVAVGETWTPNVLLAAREIEDDKDFGDSITAEGNATLDAAQGDGEKEVATVSYHLDLTGMKAPLANPFTPIAGDGKVDVIIIIPAKRQGVTSKDSTIDANYVSEARSPDGRQVTATVKLVRQRKDTVTWK